jgi:hypothetical protein
MKWVLKVVFPFFSMVVERERRDSASGMWGPESGLWMLLENASGAAALDSPRGCLLDTQQGDCYPLSCTRRTKDGKDWCGWLLGLGNLVVLSCLGLSIEGCLAFGGMLACPLTALPFCRSCPSVRDSDCQTGW